MDRNFKYKFGRAVPERITSKERTDMPKSGCTLRNKLRFDKWQLFVGAFVMAVDIPPHCDRIYLWVVQTDRTGGTTSVFRIFMHCFQAQIRGVIRPTPTWRPSPILPGAGSTVPSDSPSNFVS
ncbi:hypothetical protein MGG_18065 [Pyricularia oryzae 70-15]|uniref:Uncharacterized protein n=1 Tax=Pyricularia oryzae (strain 70-15 / ATCC MYA-4617 / FGSC 8958) TaxID=242507 RepID=G5EHR7_PYRO7|nr:uncharacterized protein MGG_18065 [Pyricularia oryzae 70-15]EAQ70687.1 hypothetical protein MGCH7_ch7g94 [Pyricularia oryzae 70-15]EHA46666.1 hypothetical protein MGG_18065 [Pyricularia oryzae 70-15]